MSSLPTWVKKHLKTFIDFLVLAYEMKPYKLKALQPSLNVKQVVEIRQDLEL
jgi:hypothetical protein